MCDRSKMVSGSDREVNLAFVTAVEASLARRDAILTGTGGTGNTFRPETALKVDSRCLFVRKHLNSLKVLIVDLLI